MTYVVRCKFIIYIFLVQENDYAFFTQFHNALFMKASRSTKILFYEMEESILI